MSDPQGISEESVIAQLTAARQAGRCSTVVLLPGAAPFLQRQVAVWVRQWGGTVVFEDERALVTWG